MLKKHKKTNIENREKIMKISIKSNKKYGSEIKNRGKMTRKKKKTTKKYAN